MARLKRFAIGAGLAGLFSFILALITNVTEFPLLFASLASSIIIVFMKPGDDMSQPKSVVGSHLLAGLSGVTSIWITQGNLVLASALSLFILILLMGVLGVFHPPAGGTAWSFALYPHSTEAMIGLVGGVMLLSLVTLGGRESLTLHLLFYFYGTPFHRDTPVDEINEIEEVLEAEHKIIQNHPQLKKKVRDLRLERNEKLRKLFLLVLEDQIKDKKEEQKLIRETRKIDRELLKHETKELKELDTKLDKALKELNKFIKEFGED